MKPFDLEAAKRGEPIITREGRPVKFIAHVPEAVGGQRVIVFDGEFGYRLLSEDGSYIGDGVESVLDLFMAPRVRTVWVNLYSTGPSVWYESKAAADTCCGQYRIGNRAWPLEIED